MDEIKNKSPKKPAAKKKKDGRRRKVPKGMRAVVARRALRAEIFRMSQAELEDLYF